MDSNAHLHNLTSTSLNAIFVELPEAMPQAAYVYTDVQIAGINALRVQAAKSILTLELSGTPERDYAELSYLRGQLAVLDQLLELIEVTRSQQQGVEP